MPKLILGDCLTVMKKSRDNQIDALVTDPPAGISFMGKEWDSDKGGRDEWIKWMTQVMTEAYRVMKPGAHGLVWALPRTSHWTATALENAGFEVRDVVTHLFGTGFPKSMDISKAIDKAAGAKQEVLGVLPSSRAKPGNSGFMMAQKLSLAPVTDAAKQWQGWGSALKPASEHWILIRKPVSEKTVAANVLKWGTGGINIDACRVEGVPRTTHKDGNKITNSQGMFTMGDSGFIPPTPTGRFPANLILDEEAAAALDVQSGLKQGSGKVTIGGTPRKTEGHIATGSPDRSNALMNYGDTGGASRFFFIHRDEKCSANIVKLNSNLQKELDDFAQKLAAISVRHDTNLNGILLRFTHEMQSVLKNECGINIETFLNSVERFSQELWHTSMSHNNHANVADNQMLIDTTRIIQDLLMSDSFVESATLPNTSQLRVLGVPDSISRFIYVAKASKADKGENNSHPTVKSTKLMEYLIKLITPPGGVILDPFLGSGSTGVAAQNLGFRFIGIEREPEYFRIAKARIEGVKEEEVAGKCP